MEILKNNYSLTYKQNNDLKFVIEKFPNTYDCYYKESLRAAEEIWSNKSGPLYIMYSGGIDSEFTLSIFLELGMNVIPVIIKMLPYYNIHDIKYAFEFCRQKNITPKVIDVNFDQFVNSERIFEVAQEFNCAVFQRTVLLDTIPKLDGTIIASHEEPYLEYDLKTKVWNFVLDEHDVIPFEILYKKYSIVGTPFFLRYTIEQFAAFLKNSNITQLVNSYPQTFTNSVPYKVDVYNSDNNFNLKKRPKYHGYEIISANKIRQHEVFLKFNQLKQTFNKKFEMNYNNLLKYIKIN